MSNRLCRSLLGTMLTTPTPLCIFDPHPPRAHSQRPGHPQVRLCISISISSPPTVLPHMVLLIAPRSIRYSNRNRNPSRNPSTSNMSSSQLAPQPFLAYPSITSNNLRNSQQFIGPTTQKVPSRTRLRLPWRVHGLEATPLCTLPTPKERFTWPPALHPAPLRGASL